MTCKWGREECDVIEDRREECVRDGSDGAVMADDVDVVEWTDDREIIVDVEGVAVAVAESADVDVDGDKPENDSALVRRKN